MASLGTEVVGLELPQVASSAEAQNSIGLQLPDPGGLRDFPVDKELGNIGVGQAE